jgi:hypothetical protein
MLSLPFVHSNEVWTGIEYQVASHLMMMGEVEKRLEIVRACRDRYNGIVRNPLGDFTSFISTNRGFGNAGLKGGKPFLETVYGEITVKRFVIE